MPKNLFEKGNSGGPGRPKGSLNKTTARARRMLADFINEYSSKVPKWVDDIEDPKDRVDAFAKVLPFVMPKMQLIEVDNGGPAYDPLLLTEDEQHELASLEVRRRELLNKCIVIGALDEEDD